MSPNGWIYDNVSNNGVYKAGFATSQQAYDEAVDAVFTSLERLETDPRPASLSDGQSANGSRHSPVDNAGTLRPGICDPF